MPYIPRQYQEEAIQDIVEYARKNPYGRLLVVVAPGAGKTLISTKSILSLQSKVGYRSSLVVGHRREMVFHHYFCFRNCGVLDVGVQVGSYRINTKSPIQIVSAQTITRNIENSPPGRLLVTDEAHRDASPLRRKLRRSYEGSFQLGLTATPYRLDGKDLREDFDDMLEVSSISELIMQGYLVAPQTYTVPPELLPQLNDALLLRKEYNGKYLEKKVNRKALVGSIVEHWKKNAKGLPTICFASSIEHSRHIVASFEKAGVRAAHLDQNTGSGSRTSLLAQLKDPKSDLTLVSCVDVLAEGWDCPPCKCVILARPTMSLTLHLQQTGRGMRPWKGVIPIILDHAGNTVRHGLPHMERDWSLQAGSTTPKEGRAPAKVCGGCLLILPSRASVCPECGWEFQSQPRVLEEKAGDLQEMILTEEVVQEELARIKAFADHKGFSEEWVQKVYEVKFNSGHPPQSMYKIDEELSQLSPDTFI